MRRIAFVSVLLTYLASCAPSPVGPAAPIAREQVTTGPALDASSARQAVVAFIEAYEAAPTEGVGRLAGTITGSELSAWVRWLNVQHREFEGTIDASADIRDVEFIDAVRVEQTDGAHVGLSASVAFTFDPFDDDPLERTRVLDGPVTLVRTATGTYRVVDLFRDGVAMSDGIELFRRETRTEGGITVHLDSLFMFPPNWQFNVVVEDGSGRGAELDPSGVGLFVRGDGGFERTEGVVTRSLALVTTDQAVDGLLVFPAQDSAEGRVLTIAYRSGGRLHRFDFPLDDLVSAVPPPAPS